MADQRIIFADVETTTDSPDTGHVWEIALIVRDTVELTDDVAVHRLHDTEYLWHVRPPLHNANPVAISPKIGDYYNRCKVSRQPAGSAVCLAGSDGFGAGEQMSAARVACEIAHLLPGCLFVAANPAFDSGYLNRFLRDNDQCPTWDYHLRDIGSLVTGYATGVRAAGGFHASGESKVARWPESLKLDDMARAVGIDPDGYPPHEGMPDCRKVRDIYDRVMGGAR